MNCKGLFCFLIVLAFAGMQLQFLNQSAAAKQELERAEAIAIEAEQLNLIKTGIEINVDSLVRQTLRDNLLQNKEPEQIKSSVNGKLLRFFKAIAEGYAGTAEITFFPGKGALSLLFLNENSKVNVVKYGRHVIAAEYTFTGGLLRDKEVAAEVRGQRTTQFFKMPAGYTIRATVAG